MSLLRNSKSMNLKKVTLSKHLSMKDISDLVSILNKLNNKTLNVNVNGTITENLINGIILVVIIAFLAVFAVVITKLYKSYPRLFWIGHSEDLKKYMERHVKVMVKCLHTLRRNARGELRRIVEDLFRLQCVPPMDLAVYSPRDAPFLYLPYMFRRALLGGKKPDKGELTLYSRLMGTNTLMLGKQELAVYDMESDNGQVTDDVVEIIKKRVSIFSELDRHLGQLMCSYKGNLKYDEARRKCMKEYKWCNRASEFPDTLNDPKAEMARRVLTFLAHEYTPTLEKMYDLRKSGGLGNFVIYNIYMGQYINFIFKEQVPGIWDSFLDDVKKVGESFIKVVGSAKVSSFMASLPFRIIGQTDNFNEEHSPIDEREEFFLDGFGNMLKGLMQLLPNLLKLILSLVQLITNPLKIIQYIFGLVLGILLYILYMIVMALSPLFYIPAFMWVLAFKVIMTAIWVGLFLSLALFYFVLWILNQGTGGVVFDMLRCENLPDAWHRGASYLLGNRYKRQFLCSYPCTKGWLPWGCLCTKSPKYQPPFCPQQIIMTRYIQHLADEEPSSSADSYYEFKPDVEYLTKKEHEKRQILEDYVNKEASFAHKCADRTSAYDFILRYACEHAEELGLKGDAHFMKSCKHCFCKRFYSGTCKKGYREQKIIYLIKTKKRLEEGVPLNDFDLIKLREQSIRLSPSPRNMNILYPKYNEIVYMMPPGAGEAYPQGDYLPNFCDEVSPPGQNQFKGNPFPTLQQNLPRDNTTAYYVVYSILMLVTTITGIALLTKKIKGM